MLTPCCSLITAGGMLTPRLVQSMRDSAPVLLTVDAQGQLEKYRNVDVLKCNAADASAYLRRDLRTKTDFTEAAHDLCADLEAVVTVIITRGADGATLCTADGQVHHCPSPIVTDVYDTVGAGDTAIAVTTLALAAGASPYEAVMLANVASG
ncbi:MAG: ribokinase, partial [Blastochloris sp.]|nr:ribokinase [Blastochloris sp.]